MFAFKPPFADAAALVARAVLGVLLIVHGWQKLAAMSATIQAFTSMGIPLPGVAAVYAVAVEMLGGALIVAGLAVPTVAVLVVLDMLGAGYYAGHFAHGLYVADGGWELIGLIMIGVLLLAAHGPGRFSVDHAVRRAGRQPERVLVAA